MLDDEEQPTELTVRPGNQAGWSLPLTGLDRCRGQGHELESVFGYSSGLLIGYCLRCDARVEIPWFRGGTAAALARAMTTEALKLNRPAASVVEDLDQVLGLLREDAAAVETAKNLVQNVTLLVKARRRQVQ